MGAVCVAGDTTACALSTQLVETDDVKADQKCEPWKFVTRSYGCKT